ncbi:GNAT family N-acetyltransferase [Streptomyces sp. NPDC048172]|uniref:GNAT family N-acetyltransferase n=1 Tax=Streptomyces sp. NPDC048172 TaxID=3365505 RepID=UPI00371FBE5D
MTVTRPAVRPFRPQDAEAVAGIRRTTEPFLVLTAETLLWKVTSSPASQRVRWLVAEDADGTPLGCAETGLVAGSTRADEGFLHVAVPPDRTGHGVGGALVTAGEARLTEIGARRAHTWVRDEPHALAFAGNRGYERRRAARFLGLDLVRAALPPLPDPLPPGVELRTAADFGENLRPLYEADLECAADEPGEVATGRMPYEDWLRLNWGRPDYDRVLTSVALVGGEVAAFSVAQTDGRERYWSGMTGTRRPFRGRGLARLAKLDSLRRARAAGIRHAFTGNDATNAPMLAVNRRFGYTAVGEQWRCVRRLQG